MRLRLCQRMQGAELLLRRRPETQRTLPAEAERQVQSESGSLLRQHVQLCQENHRVHAQQRVPQQCDMRRPARLLSAQQLRVLQAVSYTLQFGHSSVPQWSKLLLF